MKGLNEQGDDNKGAARLTFAEANALCRQFLPLGDALFENIAGLEKSGFGTFRPTLELTTACCHTEDERELHRKRAIESAKEALGRPHPFRVTAEERSQFYRSPS